MRRPYPGTWTRARVSFRMLVALFSTAALADPSGDVWDAMRARMVRELVVDQLLGVPQDRRTDAWRWDGIDPAGTGDEALFAALVERIEPEDAARTGAIRRPILVSRPWARVGIGPLTPIHEDGDREDGLLSPRIGADNAVYAGPFEARIAVDAGLDALPGVDPRFDVRQWRLGVRTPGFEAAISQESRWYGPGRNGSLLQTDAAHPLPALTVGGDTHLPGKAASIGRFSARADVGIIPGDRRDVHHPGFLVFDLRYAPVPWIELGATRNAVFGGRDPDGTLRPIDVGQLILPTEPHVYDDPEHLRADTDERVAIDLRVTLPLGRWGLPVDYLEATIQNGGEDVIARQLGPIPVPSLAGSANVYGLEAAKGPYFAGFEAAVIQDDVFRWYVGHRVYHDGWTTGGVPIGHPRGGDQRSWSAEVGRVDPKLGIELGFEHVHRLEVAELLDRALFTFPAEEVRDVARLRVSRPGARGSSLSAELAGGPLVNEDFVPGEDRVDWRVGLAWTAGWKATGGEGGWSGAPRSR
jgi:hypothetical protein